MMHRNVILQGDALTRLREIPDCTVQTCCSSPPYYGLRAYLPDGHPDKPHEIGLEETPEGYIDRLVEVFREVRRVLRRDGTLWVNIGDSYAGSGKGGQSEEKRSEHWQPTYAHKGMRYGMKPKDLMLIPFRLAIALQEDGWWIRSDIIWAKGNPMPESCLDRPTKSHEYLFLLAKAERYYYNTNAIREPLKESTLVREKLGYRHAFANQFRGSPTDKRFPDGKTLDRVSPLEGRNKRSVWHINASPYSEAHFAVMPPKLAEICILAGSRPGDLVLDPFAGAGTTLIVAQQHGRDYLGIELNADYIRLAEKRIEHVQQNLWTCQGEEVA